ncbi:MAG: molybdopterin-dependent oxidoreductase [Gammaproteobacteria bacterium]|nr:molybdopterin-dependent oxidoreductase [Gammaproteobacteria bacterium]
MVKGSHGWANCRSACEWDLYVKDGIVVREEQSATYEQSEPGVPDFNPRGCQKGACYTDVMYGPSRTTVPLKRVGPRGSGQWEKISWEQALGEIAEKCVSAAAEWGTDTIYQDLGPNFDFGPSTVGRFKFQFMAGGVFADNWAEIGDLNIGATMALGFAHAGGSADEWFLSDFLVVWMMNPSVTQMPDAHFLYEARYNGAELVVIDPQYSATAVHADQWLPIGVGTDAALGLAVARHLFEAGAIDLPFVREQTDLPLLVRLDTGRFLREADLRAGGSETQLYLWHPQQQAPVPAPGCTGNTTRRLVLDFEPPIEGQWTVRLADGSEAGVVPVGSMLKEHLEPWTFEHAAQVTGLPPEQIRRFAEGWARAKRPMVLSSWGSNRYVHSDLMNRAKILCLMLKGAIGRKGAGYQATGWVDLDGFSNAMQMEKDGLTGRLAVMFNAMPPGELFSAVLDIARKRKTEADVALEGERNYLRNKLCTTDVVEVNLKAPGYLAALDREQQGMFPRSLSEYREEARARDWSPGLPRKGPPRIFFSGGANLMRRNNLPQYLKAHIWDDMDLVVDVNPKFSFTGTLSDYILPAAGWYEKSGIKYTMAYVPYLHYCDVAMPPLGEQKGEWEIYWLLTREIRRIAKAAAVAGPRRLRPRRHRPEDASPALQQPGCARTTRPGQGLRRDSQGRSHRRHERREPQADRHRALHRDRQERPGIGAQQSGLERRGRAQHADALHRAQGAVADLQRPHHQLPRPSVVHRDARAVHHPQEQPEGRRRLSVPVHQLPRTLVDPLDLARHPDDAAPAARGAAGVDQPDRCDEHRRGRLRVRRVVQQLWLGAHAHQGFRDGAPGRRLLLPRLGAAPVPEPRILQVADPGPRQAPAHGRRPRPDRPRHEPFPARQRGAGHAHRHSALAGTAHRRRPGDGQTSTGVTGNPQ